MKKAFTLSEVLITLGIIGAIAIMTIPSLVKNYRYKMYGSQLQKTYSQIQNAIDTAMADEISQDFYRTTSGAADDNANCTKGGCYFLNNYFKIVNPNCGTGAKKCVADNYKNIHGASAGYLNIGYCAQTANGAAICITNNPANKVSSIFIDTNGIDAPNITGLDAFVMNFSSSGELKDWNENPDLCNTKVASYGHIADYAVGCLSKAIQNGWTIKD